MYAPRVVTVLPLLDHLYLTNRSDYLWNKLHLSFRQLRPKHSPSDLHHLAVFTPTIYHSFRF